MMLSKKAAIEEFFVKYRFKQDFFKRRSGYFRLGKKPFEKNWIVFFGFRAFCGKINKSDVSF